MFVERWWIGAIAGGIAVAGIFIFRPHFEPLYRTEATLMFETKRSTVVEMRPVTDNILQGAGELNLHLDVMRSNVFAAYVLNSFTPEEIKVIQQEYTDPLHPEAAPPSVGDIVRPGVGFSVKRTSPIVVISVTNRSPEAAKLIADKYAQKYIDYRADEVLTKTSVGLTFLQNQAEELRAQVNLATQELLDYRKEKNLTTLSESKTLIEMSLNELSTKKTAGENDQRAAKNLIDKVDEYVRAGKDLLELPQISGAANVSGLANELNGLKSEKILFAVEHGPNHFRMLELDRTIAEKERRLEEAKKFAISELRARYQQTEDYLRSVTEARLLAEGKARDLDVIVTGLRSRENELNEKTRLRNSVTARLEELRVAEQLKDTNINFLDRAWTPNAPSETGVTAVAMKACSAGFGLLFFIPLAIGLFDTRIRTPMHVEEGLQEPLLGAVKRMRKMGETQRAQVFRLQKEKDLAEAYLGNFSEIEVRSALGFPKTLLVTSSVPAEGKSLLCSNLAAVFASHKRKTLLVDCDLRRPTLHRYFGVKVDTGWVQWLESPVASRPATPLGIVAVSDDLHLLPAGRTPGNPTELLDRLSRRETLQPLLQNYDIVIFDTPPAAVFPDALLLARSCHEMIYVCRYRTVRLSVVRKVLERFRDSGVSALGIVLNQLPETKARSYGYHGYGMQSAEYYKAYAEKPEA